MFCRKLLLFIGFLLTLSMFSQGANTIYLTYLNGFGALKNRSTVIKGKYLKESNEGETLKFNVIDIDCTNKKLNCYIRFSNLNNSSGKSYSINDDNGKRKGIKNPEWGYVWNYRDSSNYYAVTFQGQNTMPYDDILDKRSLFVNVIKVVEGKKEKLYSKHMYEGVDLYSGFNCIMLDYDLNRTSIYIGDKELSQLCILHGVAPVGTLKTGYFIGAGAAVEVERFVIKTKENIYANLVTDWDKQRLDKYVESLDINVHEGLWNYLDRNLNDKSLKLGGKYTIAIVKNDIGGYDIIYYEGAKVNASMWECGMLKGRLTPTSFEGNYNMTWYDSMMNVMNDDTYAQFSDNILTLVFPVEGGQIRFVKNK